MGTMGCSSSTKKDTTKDKNSKEVAPANANNNANEQAPANPPQNNVLSKEDRIAAENQRVKDKFGWSDDHITAVREVFNKFDKSGEGTISKKEMRECAHEFGEDLSKNELKLMMDDTDQDGDGVIDFEEFCAMIQKS